MTFGKPKRRRKQGRSQNGCPIVFKCVSGEEQCDETQDQDESDGSSSEGPREPAGRSLSVRVEGSSAVCPAHTAALLKSLGQQREDGKGVFFCLVGCCVFWFFFSLREKCCLPCHRGKKMQVNLGVKYGLENLFADFLNIFLQIKLQRQKCFRRAWLEH